MWYTHDRKNPIMNVKTVKEYCLSKPDTALTFPFDQETAVFKLHGKMFALMGIHTEPAVISLKCDPQLARDLRGRHKCVEPGYHLNKEHWNTVRSAEDLPDEQILGLIDHSYDLVEQKLPKKLRRAP